MVKEIVIPKTMWWEENDAPPKDILAARLRAKFYGAANITYRPFLMMVINRPSKFDPHAPVENIPQRVLSYAKDCISALINSTKSFWGMTQGRLIVTNVWGTVHAYVYPFSLPINEANRPQSMGQCPRPSSCFERLTIE